MKKEYDYDMNLVNIRSILKIELKNKMNKLSRTNNKLTIWRLKKDIKSLSNTIQFLKTLINFNYQTSNKIKYHDDKNLKSDYYKKCFETIRNVKSKLSKDEIDSLDTIISLAHTWIDIDQYFENDETVKKYYEETKSDCFRDGCFGASTIMKCAIDKIVDAIDS